jgi:hypothetical protein
LASGIASTVLSRKVSCASTGMPSNSAICCGMVSSAPRFLSPALAASAFSTPLSVW